LSVVWSTSFIRRGTSIATDRASLSAGLDNPLAPRHRGVWDHDGHEEVTMKELVAHASIDVEASPARVWDALTDPHLIHRYMFGTTVVSSWIVGDPIVWKGEWKGKSYEDHGYLLRLDHGRLLEYNHFSPLSGKPDLPENYHTVTVELEGKGSTTHVTLSQDRNESEEARQHSEDNWKQMLEGLKRVVEEESA